MHVRTHAHRTSVITKHLMDTTSQWPLSTASVMSTRAKTNYPLTHSSSLAFWLPSSVFLSAHLSFSCMYLLLLPRQNAPLSPLLSTCRPSSPPSFAASDTFTALFNVRPYLHLPPFCPGTTHVPLSSVINLISCPLRLMRPAALCRVIDDTILSCCKATT